MVPSADATTSDWKKPQKKMNADNINNNRNNNNNENSAYRSNTFNLIGGPTPISNPSMLHDTSQWETEAQAAANRNGTFVDQMTVGGKSMYVKGKRDVKPAYENAGQYDERTGAELRGQNPYALNASGSAFERYVSEATSRCCSLRSQTLTSIYRELAISQQQHQPPPNPDEELIGFRQHQGGKNTSFLKGLGKEVARSKEFQKPKNVVTAPYATEGNLPTDPYKNANGERSKDMFVENFKSSKMPGYTGRR